MDEFQFSFFRTMSEAEKEEKCSDNGEINLNRDALLGFGKEVSRFRFL